MADIAPLSVLEDIDVPRTVRLVMQLRGKTGTDLRPVLFLSQQQISQRLGGKVQFRADELIALGRFLDVDPGLFFQAPEAMLRSR